MTPDEIHRLAEALDAANGDGALRWLLPALAAVQTAIMVSLIPWAMSVHGRLVGLETAVESIVPAKEVARRDEMISIEKQLSRIREAYDDQLESVRTRLTKLESDRRSSKSQST